MANLLSVVAQSIAAAQPCSGKFTMATERGSATVTHGGLTPRTVNAHTRSLTAAEFNTFTMVLECASAVLHTFLSVLIHQCTVPTYIHTHIHMHTHMHTLEQTHTHPGPDPSYETALRGGQQLLRISMETGGEQHIPHSILPETEDESSPHDGKQTT